MEQQNRERAELPEAFKEKMRRLLGEEFFPFLASYESGRVQGLRVNTLKTGICEFLERNYFALTEIPWADEGYYYPSAERPGRHPCHEAGVYYIQEPSAMAAVALLDPQPGEAVLDLCAAPGGKTTHIAARQKGRGLLLSNEIHPGRAKILSQNVERLGIGNAVVSNEDPAKLSGRFPEFFDRIAVDAPCSGEGMFRKDEAARAEWSPGHVAMCAARQGEILDRAAEMLKPGGRLVYSTCTFSPEEDEGTIQAFLRSHKEFSVSKAAGKYPGLDRGRPDWIQGGEKVLEDTYRIWPHKTEGEGHYLAVLEKAAGPSAGGKISSPAYIRDQGVLRAFYKFCGETFWAAETWRKRSEYLMFGDRLYLVPEQMTDMKGLRVLRPGLELGRFKKDRFEPSHGLALHSPKEEARQWYSMDSRGTEVVRYLRGEALPAAGEAGKTSVLSGKGWVLMCVDGYSLGWAKLSGGILKNHYPKGLRWVG